MMKQILKFKVLIIFIQTSTSQIFNMPPVPVQHHINYPNYFGMRNSLYGPSDLYRQNFAGNRIISPSSDSSEYSDRSERCTCSYRSCSECYKSDPCCKSACERCNTAVVAVPYPMPILLPEMPSTTTLTTRETTTKRRSTRTNPSQTWSHSTSMFTFSGVELNKQKLKFYEQTTETLLDRSDEKVKHKCKSFPKGACLRNKKQNDMRRGKEINPKKLLMRKTLPINKPYRRRNNLPPERIEDYSYKLYEENSTKWIPDIDIVPIPDEVAENLLSQLGGMSAFKMSQSEVN